VKSWTRNVSVSSRRACEKLGSGGMMIECVSAGQSVCRRDESDKTGKAKSVEDEAGSMLISLQNRHNIE
jgi:hypothetical protein